MNTYIVFSLLLILLLMKLNWLAYKKLKATSHYAKNLFKKEEIIEELIDKSFKLKRVNMITEYRVKQLAKELERQKKINLAIVHYYASDQFDVPLKHGRFFNYHSKNLKQNFTFCEN